MSGKQDPKFDAQRRSSTAHLTRTRRPLSGIAGQRIVRKPRIVMVRTRKGETIGLLRSGAEGALHETWLEKQRWRAANNRRRQRRAEKVNARRRKGIPMGAPRAA